jgi:DMSO/TMAO reductase YedYZ molybdopterin-dependent catalytic subunit
MKTLRLALLVSIAVGLAYGQTLTINGDVPAPLILKLEDLAQMPRETVSLPNPDGSKAVYEGVLLREVLKKAGVLDKALRGNALAAYITVKASDGYQVVFSLGELDAEFGNEQILLADKRDGKPLSGNMGNFRLVIANDKAGARSSRMIESIEVVKLKVPAPAR